MILLPGNLYRSISPNAQDTNYPEIIKMIAMKNVIKIKLMTCAFHSEISNVQHLSEYKVQSLSNYVIWRLLAFQVATDNGRKHFGAKKQNKT